MRKVICNISVFALCMGLGIATSNAQLPPRSGEVVRTCTIDDQGQPVAGLTQDQQVSVVPEGTSINGYQCVAGSWNKLVGGPGPSPGGGSIPPHSGSKPLKPGDPVEEVVVPGGPDRSEFNKFMDEASAEAARQRAQRGRGGRGVD